MKQQQRLKVDVPSRSAVRSELSAKLKKQLRWSPLEPS